MAKKQFDIILKARDKLSGTLKKATDSANKMSHAFRRAKADIRKADFGAAKLGKTLQKIGSGMKDVGRKLTAGVTLPIAAMGALSIRNFAEFEKGLVGVQKTTNLSTEDLQKFGKEIENLGLKIPISENALLEMAQTAGQLGVKQGDLKNFVDILGQLQVATDITGSEGASDLARFLTLTDGGVKNIKSFGDQINALGNNFAATEGEILSMGTELAKSTTQFKIKSKDVLILSASLKQLGQAPEAAGTQIGKLFIQIEQAVLKKGRLLTKFGKAAGMTGKEFADQWNQDRFTGFVKLLEGMKQNADAGKPLILQMAALGLKGDRMNKVLPPLIEKFQVFKDAQALLADESQVNGSLLGELSKQAKTLSGRFQFTQNRLAQLGRRFAKLLLPVLERVIDKFEQFFEFLKKNPEIENLIHKIILIAAAVGPVLLVFGTLTSAVGTLLIKFALLKATFAIFGGAIASFAATAGAVTVAIAGLGALSYVLVKRWKIAKEFFTKLWNGPIFKFLRFYNLVNLINYIPNKIISNWEPIVDTFKNIAKQIIAIMTPFSKFLIEFWVGPTAKLLGYNKGIDLLKDLASKLLPPWEKVKKFFVEMWDSISSSFDKMVNNIKTKGPNIAKELLDKYFIGGHFFTPDFDAMKIKPKGFEGLKKLGIDREGNQSSLTVPALGPVQQPSQMITKEITTTKVAVKDSKVTVDFKNMPKGVNVYKKGDVDINTGLQTA